MGDLSGDYEMMQRLRSMTKEEREMTFPFSEYGSMSDGELEARINEVAREQGPQGEAAEEKRAKAEYAIHGAVHQQIELRHAMEHHHDFIENGMFGRERLDTFSSMLDNDDYWDYLNDPKNKEEREKVRDQHFDAMTQAIKDKERSVFDMSPREAELQGEENMSRLRNTELEVILQDAPPEQHVEITENHNAAFEAKFGHLNEKTAESLDNAFNSGVILQDSTERNLSGREKEVQGEANTHRLQSDAVAREGEKNPPTEPVIRADLTKATIEANESPAAGTANETSVSEVAVVAASSADEWDDLLAAADNLVVPNLVEVVAKQNPEALKSFAATGTQELKSESNKLNLDKVSQELAEKTQGGVEETGKQEPDQSYAQNASPVTEPSISVS